MEFGWFLLATVLKVSFILGVTVLLYAPVFVLFERRQSAMVQDRIGPMMGGVKMPRLVIDHLQTLQMGAFGMAAAPQSPLSPKRSSGTQASGSPGRHTSDRLPRESCLHRPAALSPKRSSDTQTSESAPVGHAARRDPSGDSSSSAIRASALTSTGISAAPPVPPGPTPPGRAHWGGWPRLRSRSSG